MSGLRVCSWAGSRLRDRLRDRSGLSEKARHRASAREVCGDLNSLSEGTVLQGSAVITEVVGPINPKMVFVVCLEVNSGLQGAHLAG